jgi:hypothetical protein
VAIAARTHDALQCIADALGGCRVLAVECAVSPWTARAWLRGHRTPSPPNQRRLNVLAEELGLLLPYPHWETGVRRRTIDP